MKKSLSTTIGILTAGAVLAAGVGVAHADGIQREQVRIDFGKGWVTKAELTYPSSAKGRLPLVIFLHGSGHNDMNQTLPDGRGATFPPLVRAATQEGFATLRFNKRGVTDIGPVESTDQNQLLPEHPYEQIQLDAASVVRFAARSSKVDPSRIFLLGHSEGTNVAANLAATPQKFGIPKPAGVVEMGVVGLPVKQLLTFQIYGRVLVQLHDEFDVDGDGQLTATEVTDGLVGQPPEMAALLAPKTDKNHDGRIAIDTEAGAVLRELTHIDDYPNLPDLDPYTISYATDIARFPTVSQALPKFSGPVLMLNGENDLQTPARAAIVADAAVAAAGNKDHKIVIYPGMAHTMNITPKFQPVFGEPDKQVITEIQGWLKAHRVRSQ
ncbi:alpha/beta hydrolase family protein [Actinoplanes sp. CA-142083]|uniref:alpha/beta hydrolase family protein n=1 Tax=Actinoplanes sp. CA-142083 TaxID=3239903 RepID=UPI003D8B872B